ncbi:CPBP family intramembrane glutamic endopeptidase [Lactobacillus crispatus]|uniref:CPBP family intramembrane glutamic endopeptidase n=1 Tax=Lactobacillus crispatus TaxID=47770 RepID=UPI00195D203C|nr:CPBP family intramembrane glutamic endopeptidase [Lactobacillus crispatus]MBM6872337.1 CPBP family intramembrane metalloprotease [Lactobacillus crispatus]
MGNDLKATKNKYSISQMTIAFVVLTVVYILRGKILFFLGPSFLNSGNGKLLQAIVSLVIALICAHFANKFAGKSFKVFIKRIEQGKVRWLTALFCVIVFILYLAKASQWVQVMHKSVMSIITILLLAVAAGLCEEFLFRDLLFNLFTKILSKRRYVLLWSAILSSICFGLAHFVNLARQDFVVTFQQVIAVTSIGLMLCTIRILTNNMWLNVIMHIAFDISPLVVTGDIIGKWSAIIVSGLWIGGISLLTIWTYNHHCLKENLK